LGFGQSYFEIGLGKFAVYSYQKSYHICNL